MRLKYSGFLGRAYAQLLLARLAFRRVCLFRSDKTHVLQAERFASEGHAPTGRELRTLSDLATICGNLRNSFFSQSASHIFPAVDTTTQLSRAARLTLEPLYHGVGVPRTMLRNDLHLNAKAVIHFFSGRMRGPPYAGCRLFVISTIARFIRFEEFNSSPADSCVSLFSTCLDIMFPFPSFLR